MHCVTAAGHCGGGQSRRLCSHTGRCLFVPQEVESPDETAAHSRALGPPPAGGGGGGKKQGPDVNANSSSLIRHDTVTERAASTSTCPALYVAVKGRSLNGNREGDWTTFLPVTFDAEAHHLQAGQKLPVAAKA